MGFFAYILVSRRNGTLYTGMTDDLSRRVEQHRADAVPGFTRAYGIQTLVSFELRETRASAFIRERQIKKWNRVWKLGLIEKSKPQWRDIADMPQ